MWGDTVKKLAAIGTALALSAGFVLQASGAHAQSASTPGVTKDEITVGVTYVDLKAIRDIVQLDHGDYEAAYKAVADDINAKGGINGRRLKLVFAPVNPVGTASAEAACVKLTQDTPVFAVVGFFQNDTPLCFVEQNGTPVVGGNITTDYLARAQAPWYSPNAGDGTVNQVIDGVASEGVFKKAKVGVVGTAGQKALIDGVILPALKRNKVKATTALIDVAANDTVAAQQQAGVIAERFKSQGIDTVVVAGNAFVTFAQALEKTDYRPRLIATDRETYLGYVENPQHSKSVLEGALSGGPARDPDEPGYRRCIGVIEAKTGTQIPPAETITDDRLPNPDISAQNACFNLGLFAAMATGAGKNLTVASFGKAGKKLGVIDLPGYGKVAYDSKTHALALPVKLTRYNSATDESPDDAEPVGVKSAK
ncbi:MAG: ABC transporter substrate-binding protein [Actinomycetota bacterium]